MGRKVFLFECFVYIYDAAGSTEKNKDRKTLYSHSLFILHSLPPTDKLLQAKLEVTENRGSSEGDATHRK